ncbi:uncharacterized protein [Ptychodera flava]|uniref:uncharacterized protein n=1 Tax=Ptychodera flava TaxID=63121 RepID=UPI00396A6783
MGCSNSSHNCVSPKREECITVPTKPSLTEQQKKLLLNTWKILQEDIAKVGVIMFIGVFENHPECKESFLPFKELKRDDLRWSSELKAHGLRVMAVVERVLARIHNDEKIEELLRVLAGKHVQYGATPDLVDLFGPQFIHAIKPTLRDHWTEEIQIAWTTLFDLIIFHMQTNMKKIALENKANGRKGTATRKVKKYTTRNGQA